MKKNSFLSDIFNSFFWRIITIIINLIVGIILARYLAPEGRGIYAIIILTVVLLTLISNFGVPNAIVYYIGKKEIPLQKIFVTGFIHAIIGSSIVIILMLLVIYSPWRIYLFPYGKFISLIGILALLPEAINTQIRHFILGLKNIVLYNKLMTLDTLLLLVSIIVSLLFLKGGIEEAIIGYLIAKYVSLLVNLYMVKIYIADFKLTQFYFPFFKKTLRLGSQFFLTGIGGFGIQRINYFFLELFHSATAVGLYTVAGALPALFLIIPSQLSTVLYPWVSSAEGSETKVNLTLATIKGSLYICLLLMIPLSFLLEYVIILLYGIEYKDTYFAALILLVSMLFSGLSGVLVNYLAGIGLAKYGVYLTIINIVGLVIFGILFIPNGNIEGAAFAKLLIEFISISYLFLVFKKQAKVKLKQIFKPTKRELNLLQTSIKKVLKK